MATKTTFKPGDRVKVPWGLDDLIGIVIEVYGPRGAPSVLVEVPVHGASGEVLETTTVSYPASALEPAA
jgi:primosomal protein N'